MYSQFILPAWFPQIASMYARTYAVRRVCVRRCSGPAEAETPPPLSAPAPPAAGEGGTPSLHPHREGDTVIKPLTGRGHSQRGDTYYKEPDYDDIPHKILMYSCSTCMHTCVQKSMDLIHRKFHYEKIR